MIQTRTKTCTKCGEAKLPEDFPADLSRKDGRCPQCRSCRRRYYEANRENILLRASQYYQENRETIAPRNQEWRKRNPERDRQYHQRNRAQRLEAARSRREHLRAAVFSHYGETCACCGSVEKLTIDHIGGGGDAHRREIFGSRAAGSAMYGWLLRNNFPPSFQTLCAPCNTSKADGSSCRIHKEVAA